MAEKNFVKIIKIKGTFPFSKILYLKTVQFLQKYPII